MAIGILVACAGARIFITPWNNLPMEPSKIRDWIRITWDLNARITNSNIIVETKSGDMDNDEIEELCARFDLIRGI